MNELFIQDFPALVTALLASMNCALLGNFLLLRRQTLLGDALSHAVLPGIVVAFLVTGSLTILPMTLGALLAALLGAVAIEVVHRGTRLDYGSSMGIIFTTWFALGVVLLEWTEVRGVHLDIDHALYGNLEGIIWPAAAWSFQAWADLPHESTQMAVVFSINALWLLLFYKELSMVTFDPVFAASSAVSPRILSAMFIVMVALAAVAAFSAVGSLLVVAMFVGPAAAAARFCRRLSGRILLSLFLAAMAAVIGYGVAVLVPTLWGAPSLNAAGMIALCAALIHVVAVFATPQRPRHQHPGTQRPETQRPGNQRPRTKRPKGHPVSP